MNLVVDSQAPVVDLEAAHGWAEFGEVLGELGDASTEGGVGLDDVGIETGLSRLDSDGHAADAPADDENAAVHDAFLDLLGHAPYSPGRLPRRRIRSSHDMVPESRMGSG